jgi:hypothetical protein
MKATALSPFLSPKAPVHEWKTFVALRVTTGSPCPLFRAASLSITRRAATC